MILPIDNLRSHISRRPTSILIIIRNPNPSDTHISNPEISPLIDDQILRLDITMDNIIRMDILKPQYYTADEEFDNMLRKCTMFTSMISEITTWH